MLKGCFAIVSIMTGNAVSRLEGKYYGLVSLDMSNNSNIDELKFISNEVDEAKVKITVTITFLVGVIQVFRSYYHSLV
jgi:hypothetical protein